MICIYAKYAMLRKQQQQKKHTQYDTWPAFGYCMSFLRMSMRTEVYTVIRLYRRSTFNVPNTMFTMFNKQCTICT